MFFSLFNSPRINFSFLTSLCLLALLAGCDNDASNGYRIGLSMHFMRDDYAARLVDTVRSEFETRPGFNVIVTDANADPQKQITDMENLIIQGVDAIIVVPIDEKAVLPAIRRANATRIPVVAITKIPGADVLTTIGANGDYENGRATGELMIRATGGEGKLAMIGIPYSLWRVDQREKGFLDTIEDSKLEVVVKQSGLDQAEIQDTVSSILTSHPDLDGIWCAFSNQIVGAADALRAANRKDIVLTGVDADQAIIKRIKNGWITGTAAQFPGIQGHLAAEAVIRYLEGQPVEGNYDVPVELVTKHNAAVMSKRIWGN